MVVANNAHARVPNVYRSPGRQPDFTAKSRPQKQSRAKQGVMGRVMAGLLVVALALLVIYRYGQISQINMDINRSSNALNALADEQRHLQISLAQLTALERLEQFALELGMQYPHPDQLKYVGESPLESGDEDGK